MKPDKDPPGIPRRDAIVLTAAGFLGLTDSVMNAADAQTENVRTLDYKKNSQEVRSMLTRVKNGTALILDTRDPNGPSETTHNGAPWGLRCAGTTCPPQNIITIPALDEDPDLIFSVTDEERLAKIPKDREILVVCAAGVRSDWALKKLKILGFTSLVTIRGGISSIPDSAHDIRFGIAPSFPTRDDTKGN